MTIRSKAFRAPRSVLVTSSDVVGLPMDVREREAADELGRSWAEEALEQLRLKLSKPIPTSRKSQVGKTERSMGGVAETSQEIARDVKRLEDAIGRVSQRRRQRGNNSSRR